MIEVSIKQLITRRVLKSALLYTFLFHSILNIYIIAFLIIRRVWQISILNILNILVKKKVIVTINVILLYFLTKTVKEHSSIYQV